MVRWYAGTLQHEGACFPEYSFMGFDIHYKYSFAKVEQIHNPTKQISNF